jgi:hypothetical protein
MVVILFGLFVENSNGELRRTAGITSSPQNNSYSYCSGTVYLCLDIQLLFLFRHTLNVYFDYTDIRFANRISKREIIACLDNKILNKFKKDRTIINIFLNL